MRSIQDGQIQVFVSHISLSRIALAAAALLVCVPGCAAMSNGSVYWYTASADSRQVNDSFSVATGFYMCCGKIKILKNGTVDSRPVSELAAAVKAGNGRPVQHTISIDPNVTWGHTSAMSDAADAIVQLLVASNATGAMIDYEPPSSLWKPWGAAKTRAVANDYAHWASLLSAKLHTKGLFLGLDLSGDCGGSPIDLYDVFAANATVVDQLMLMSTYRDIHDSLFYEKELVSRALTAGIRPSQLSVGIGSVSVSDPVRYGWNASDLNDFLRWVKGQGITQLGIWRSDIDVYKPPVQTVPFFLRALRDFLGN
jgi:hypothetical protein